MILLYIDPGAGSMVIQVFLAALLGVPYLLRTRFARLIGRIRSGGRDHTDEASGS